MYTKQNHMTNMYETLVFSVVYISLLFLLYHRSETRQAFVATWNAPSDVCSKKYKIDLQLKSFRIAENENASFRGKDVVLFYEPLPGLYPKYLSNGTALNGGIPQRVPIEHHVQKVADDLSHLVPAKNFAGKGVIDWESWRPIFQRNTFEPDKLVYINESRKLAKTLYPSWNSSMIDKMAKAMFEESARELMVNTLKIVQDLRPRGTWGFYGFPRCFNYKIDEDECQKDTIELNDQLHWLFRVSTSLFPSIYLSSKFPSSTSRQKRVQGILNETLRVYSLYSAPRTPMYSYTTYRYTDSNEFYLKEDLINTIGQSCDAGMDGVMLWDSSKNFESRQDCESLQNYLQSTLGPLVKSVTNFAEKCSTVNCNGHGKCVRNSWMEASGLQMLISRNVYNFDNYKCRCYEAWKGVHCNERG